MGLSNYHGDHGTSSRQKGRGFFAIMAAKILGDGIVVEGESKKGTYQVVKALEEEGSTLGIDIDVNWDITGIEEASIEEVLRTIAGDEEGDVTEVV